MITTLLCGLQHARNGPMGTMNAKAAMHVTPTGSVNPMLACHLSYVAVHWEIKLRPLWPHHPLGPAPLPLHHVLCMFNHTYATLLCRRGRGAIRQQREAIRAGSSETVS